MGKMKNKIKIILTYLVISIVLAPIRSFGIKFSTIIGFAVYFFQQQCL